MTTKLEAELAIATIDKHPKNPRHRAVADEDMVASVRENGLIQPVVVAPGAPGRYTLIAGHRRLDASKKAKRKTVPAVIREDLTTEAQQLEAMIIENGHRLDLTPIEEAEGYAQLELLGYKAPAIAAAVGRNVKTVRERLKLLKLAPSTRKKVHSGQMNLDDAAAFVEFADDVDVTQRLEKVVNDAYSFKTEVRRQRQWRDARRRIAIDTAKLLERGATEIKLKDGESAYSVFDYDRGPCPVTRTHSDNWDQHKECLGFIAYDSAWNGPLLDVVCTNPAGHKDQLDVAAREAIEAREKEQREEEAREQAEAIATELRAETLMNLVGTNTVMPANLRDLVRALLPDLLVQLSGGVLEFYQATMNVPDVCRWKWISDPKRDAQTPNMVRLRDHLADVAVWSDGILTRALVAVLIGEAESNLDQSWRRHPRLAIDYLDLLKEAGHDFGPIDDELRAGIMADDAKAAS